MHRRGGVVLTSVELRGVTVSYNGSPALKGLTLSLATGAWLGVIGPNGAGKTTIIRAIAGLVPSSGEIRVAETPISSMRRRALARAVAYVPQRPLVPVGTPVADYVLMGRNPHIPYFGTETRHDLEIVRVLLGRLELAAFAERPLGSLSGGEIQRAVLARALAQEASILLLDEPTTGLDVGHQQQVLELVDELRIERELTVVSAMHDLTVAGQFADRLLLLSGGRAVAVGPARSVLTEAVIREHYGAWVEVVDRGNGEVAVVPTRSREHPVTGLKDLA